MRSSKSLFLRTFQTSFGSKRQFAHTTFPQKPLLKSLCNFCSHNCCSWERCHRRPHYDGYLYTLIYTFL